MKLARLSLLVAALGFGAFGAVLLVVPFLLEPAGVAARNTSGTVELRAFYGGLELGLAAFFLLARRRPDWLRPALVVQVAALGGVALARALALLLAGGAANVVIYVSWAGEILVTLLGVAALRRVRS
jgi:hypothetical protein